jgi:hypothetical protein
VRPRLLVPTKAAELDRRALHISLISLRRCQSGVKSNLKVHFGEVHEHPYRYECIFTLFIVSWNCLYYFLIVPSFVECTLGGYIWQHEEINPSFSCLAHAVVWSKEAASYKGLTHSTLPLIIVGVLYEVTGRTLYVEAKLIRLSVCVLLSATKPSVGFHDIRYNSLQNAVGKACVLWKSARCTLYFTEAVNECVPVLCVFLDWFVWNGTEQYPVSWKSI